MSNGILPAAGAMAILTDTTICVGCERCVMACESTWRTGDTIPSRHAAPDGLSGNRWTSVVKIEERFVRKHCLHCVAPSCVAACPVHAFYKIDSGPVIYMPGKCIGCRYCMIACPFKIPRYDWDEPIPFVQKCKFCFERLQAGGNPACTSACPYGATVYGPRAELVAQAHARIKNKPDVYVPHVYGETDFGGTSVLYVSDVPLEPLGFPTKNVNVPGKSLPAYSYPVARQTPFMAAAVFGSLAGITWIINRRMELAGIKQDKKD